MRNCSPFSKPYRRLYIAGLVFYIVAAAWLIVTAALPGKDIVICPVRLLLGVNCPGCGMTRAALCLLKGDVSEAFMLNANSIIIIPLLLAFAVCGLTDLLTSRLYACRLCSFINSALKRPTVLVPFAIIELALLYYQYIY